MPTKSYCNLKLKLSLWNFIIYLLFIILLYRKGDLRKTFYTKCSGRQSCYPCLTTRFTTGLISGQRPVNWFSATNCKFVGESVLAITVFPLCSGVDSGIFLWGRVETLIQKLEPGWTEKYFKISEFWILYVLVVTCDPVSAQILLTRSIKTKQRTWAWRKRRPGPRSST